jgi:ABC-2 type transport system permease protein
VLAFALALLPALGLLTLAYVWVMRTDADFREAALARAREAADRVRAGKGAEMRRAARVSAKRRRPPFRLSPRGSAQVAIFWKNLISAGRLSPRRFAVFALAIGTITVVFWGGQRDGGQFIAAAIGTMAGIMAGCLTLIGPLLIRDDLRSDLLHVDLLKTFPIAGWRLVLGEVLAPAALLTLIEWVLLVLAAVLLPAAGEVSLTMSGRAGYGLAAAVMLPLISAIGVIVQNAVALLMPGWVELGKRHARGVEAMGQRLISMVGTALVLILASIPVGFVFAAAYFSGYWLLGPAVVPVAIAIAAAGLALESAIAVALLGRVFDRFDPSRELDAF